MNKPYKVIKADSVIREYYQIGGVMAVYTKTKLGNWFRNTIIKSNKYYLNDGYVIVINNIAFGSLTKGKGEEFARAKNLSKYIEINPLNATGWETYDFLNDKLYTVSY